jgi:flagellar basal body-associated protein FliL
MDIGLENQLEKPNRKHKKVIIGSIIFLCVILAIYFGTSIYFINHFYYGTQINGINVSGKAVEDVNKQMATDLKTYTLNLKERDGKYEQIKADEVGLKYNSGGDLEVLRINKIHISGFQHSLIGQLLKLQTLNMMMRC